MKIQFSDFTPGATGKQAGSIYKRGPYGAVKYNKTGAPPIRTRQFGSIQAALSNISGEWRKLTHEDRQSWRSFAKSGFSIPGQTNSGQYSGVTAFQSCNMNRLKLSLPILLSPVMPVHLSSDFIFAAIPNSGGNLITLICLPQFIGVYSGVLYASTLRGYNITHPPKSWKIIDVFPFMLPIGDNAAFAYNFFFGETWLTYPYFPYNIPFKMEIIDFNSGIVVADPIYYGLIN